MSDLAMYEALASAALRRCGTDYRKLRRALLPLQDELRTATTDEQREGLNLVVRKLREKLEELQPDLPLLGGD